MKKMTKIEFWTQVKKNCEDKNWSRAYCAPLSPDKDCKNCAYEDHNLECILQRQEGISVITDKEKMLDLAEKYIAENTPQPEPEPIKINLPDIFFAVTDESIEVFKKDDLDGLGCLTIRNNGQIVHCESGKEFPCYDYENMLKVIENKWGLK